MGLAVVGPPEATPSCVGRILGEGAKVGVGAGDVSGKNAGVDVRVGLGGVGDVVGPPGVDVMGLQPAKTKTRASAIAGARAPEERRASESFNCRHAPPRFLALAHP